MAAIGWVSAAAAQTAPPSTDVPAASDDMSNDIVVTAQKRAERVRDIPLSITAVSGADLALRGLSDAQSLSFNVPGLSVFNQGGGQLDISIRGVQSYRGKSSLTGVYVDDAPLSGLQSGFIAGYVDFAAVDLQRVEVLKGPQGTLFGEGAVGGVLRYITNDPALDKVSGSITLSGYTTQGGDPSGEATGVINLPLTDKLGVRVTGLYKTLGGWIENVGTGVSNYNDEQVGDVRVKALWQPTARLTIKALANVHRDRGDGNNIVNYPLLTTFRNYEGTSFLQAFDPKFPTNYRNDFELYNLSASYDLGFATLLSSTSRLNTNSSGQYTQLYGGTPPAGNPYPLFEQVQLGFGNRLRMTTEELRLTSASTTPFKWVLGASYKDQSLDAIPGSRYARLTYGARVQQGINAGVVNNTLSKSWAVYGDLSYKIASMLEVGGGLRYFDDKRHDSDNVAGHPSFSGSFGKLTYRAFARLKVNDNINIYGNIGSGFRSGGFNAANKVAMGAPAHIGNETSIAYEVGTKTSFLDGAVAFDFAAFETRYRDQQQDVTLINSSGVLVQYTTNAGNANIRGLEWLLSLRPVRSFKLNFSGDVFDSKYTKVSPVAAVYVGDPMSFVPNFDLQVSANYQFHWASDLPGFIDIDLTHRGKQYSIWRGLTLGSQYDVSHPLTFLQASVGISYQGFQFTVFGKNLLNERHPLVPNPTGVYAQGRPRQIGVTIGKSF
ncbi:TonB-dependent receptor [Sphingomonas sp.]|uniref:TonB-dependent receptor n=1 Tax=Sphingomonas sp. TaxID=28214 RepID=UPI0025E02B87|nr:TonB-dependent receptor [Sphingomonas sp.]